jgi:hypothetical protein
MKISVLATAVALALGANVASASIAYDSPENGSGWEGEVFLEAFNGTNTSYIYDTGLRVRDFITNTGVDGWTINLTSLGLPTLPAGSVWGVKGARDDGYFSLNSAGWDPQSPANLTGAVATAATTPDDAGVAGFDALIGMVKNHAQSAWQKEFDTSGTPPNYPQNLFQSFTSVDDAYYANLGPQWNSTIGFDSDAPVSTTSLPFYFLTSNGSNGVVGKNGMPFGTWTFNGSQLTYNAAATAPVPVPAAVWLFGSALAGLATISRRKNNPA